MRKIVALLAGSCLFPAMLAGVEKSLPPPVAGGPAVVARSLALAVVPDLAAVVAGPEGRRLWRETLYLPGATLVKAHVVDLELRRGDVLRVRDASGRLVEELTGRGPKDAASFWTLSAFGDTLDLELDFRAPYAKPPFRVDEVLAGEPGLWREAPFAPEDVCAPPDFEDVVCYQGDAPKWSNVLASVGVMTVGGVPATGLWCSGSNVSPLNYVLTNYHCIPGAGSCANSEFVFSFYNTTCGGGVTSTWTSFRCDATVAESPLGDCDATVSTLDFTLNSVIGDPSAQFGYVQPDPVRLTDGEAIYIVQHPDGRPHEITHGSGSDVDVDATPGKSVIRYYDTLDTEGGSSGSPIFREADDRMVGIHHCGGCTSPGVGNRGMLMSDIHPLIFDYLCSETFSLTTGGYASLSEVAGNGDLVLDGGETWSFLPRVRNASCDLAATAVQATFVVDPSSAPTVTLLQDEATFGDIPAGDIATASAPIVFQLSADFPCGGLVAIDVATISATEGGPFGPADLLLTESGLDVFMTLLAEDFSGGLAAWTVVDGGSGGGAAATWTTANPGGRNLSLAAPFAIVDSDAAGSGASQDEQLVSAVLDASGMTSVEVRFQHDFNWYSGGQAEKADVDVRSTATGGSWVNVQRFEGADTGGPVTVDASAQAAGQPDVQVRFRYHTATYEYWWAIDDIRVGVGLGPRCHAYAAGELFWDDFEFGSTERWDLTQP